MIGKVIVALMVLGVVLSLFIDLFIFILGLNFVLILFGL